MAPGRRSRARGSADSQKFCLSSIWQRHPLIVKDIGPRTCGACCFFLFVVDIVIDAFYVRSFQLEVDLTSVLLKRKKMHPCTESYCSSFKNNQAPSTVHFKLQASKSTVHAHALRHYWVRGKFSKPMQHSCFVHT